MAAFTELLSAHELLQPLSQRLSDPGVWITAVQLVLSTTLKSRNLLKERTWNNNSVSSFWEIRLVVTADIIAVSVILLTCHDDETTLLAII